MNATASSPGTELRIAMIRSTSAFVAGRNVTSPTPAPPKPPNLTTQPRASPGPCAILVLRFARLRSDRHAQVRRRDRHRALLRALVLRDEQRLELGLELGFAPVRGGGLERVH